MNSTLKVILLLLVSTFFFHGTINYMAENIGDFESVALPPKKRAKPFITSNPVIKIDATSKQAWTLVDFSTGKTFKIKDPESEKDKLKALPWDFGFQRTKIITNGGITNPDGRVGLINMGPVKMEDVEQAPETGYLQDGRSFGKVLNKGIADWYNYRTRTHNVESKRNVYVVRTSQGNFMKMRILNYYCTRDEAECRSVMCTREEAACLTIEYVLQPDGGREFLPPSPKQVVQNTGVDLR